MPECTPGVLMELAKCFNGLSVPQLEGIKAYLLSVAAGVEPDLSDLMEASKCFQPLTEPQLKAIQTYLLCQIANAEPPPPEGLEFLASELSGVGFALGGDSQDASISFPNLTTCDGNLLIRGNSALLSVSLPLLATVTGGGILSFNSNSVLPSISLPALTDVSGNFNGFACAALVSISAPLLTTAAEIEFNVCPNLTTITLSSYLPPDGSVVNFQDCALTEASVDHILARCVANAAYVTGTVSLEGGTNAPPGVAGAADVIILTGRGVTVTTN